NSGRPCRIAARTSPRSDARWVHYVHRKSHQSDTYYAARAAVTSALPECPSNPEPWISRQTARQFEPYPKAPDSCPITTDAQANLPPVADIVDGRTKYSPVDCKHGWVFRIPATPCRALNQPQ